MFRSIQVSFWISGTGLGEVRFDKSNGGAVMFVNFCGFVLNLSGELLSFSRGPSFDEGLWSSRI